jgi:glycosyltransferase involved in cell wall biosynthesis
MCNVKLSLGILAFNEAENIGRMIQSLCQQTIFHHGVDGISEIELFCIPNGCTDDTAAIARAAFDANLPPAPRGTFLKSTVHVIPRACKCNAWNVFVHEVSDRDASYLCLMDADIFDLAPESIANMIRLLMTDPHIQVATDRPIKTIPEEKSHGWFRKFSMASSGVGDPGIHAICGQLYMGRAEALRQIWIPSGLFCEDGFIRASILTDYFRSAEDFRRVLRADAASHRFEGEVNLRSLVRHEKNIVIGSYTNKVLYGFLYNVASSEANPLFRLRAECQKDPSWVRNLVREQMTASGPFFIPKTWTRRRWLRLKGLGFLGKLKTFPVVFVGWMFDVYMARLSEIELRRRQGLGFW